MLAPQEFICGVGFSASLLRKVFRNFSHFYCFYRRYSQKTITQKNFEEIFFVFK